MFNVFFFVNCYIKVSQPVYVAADFKRIFNTNFAVQYEENVIKRAKSLICY